MNPSVNGVSHQSVRLDSQLEANIKPAVNGEHVTSDYIVKEVPMGTRRKIKVIFVGFGLAGIDWAYKTQHLPDIDLQIYEKNNEAGGTWLENTYPGVACDVPIAVYQLPWAIKSDWNDFYATGPEICQYLQQTAKEHDLYRFVKMRHQILAADWLEHKGKWRVKIMQDNDPSKIIYDEAEFLINGGGALNEWTWPDIAGLHDFKGPVVHSAAFNHDVDLTGKRVGVVGIGSSAVQLVAAIAQKVGKLYLFNRSPTWIIPGFAGKYVDPNGKNLQYTEEVKQRFTKDPADYLEYIKSVDREIGGFWKAFTKGTPENVGVNEYARKDMHDQLENRQDLIEKLVPTTFAVGCRRPTPGTGFLQALVLPKTKLITGDISSITESGLIHSGGELVELDVIICCTGFDTSFRPRFPINVRGQNMQDIIGDHGDGQRLSYLALASPGIPNYFVCLSAYTPAVQGSASMTIFRQLAYMLKVIQKVQVESIKELAPKWSAAREFVQHADEFLKRTIWSDKCPSWYKNGNPDGKAAIWPGSRVHSLRAIESPRYEDYDIKYHNDNRFGYFGNGWDVGDFDGTDTTWYYQRPEGSKLGNKLPDWKL